MPRSGPAGRKGCSIASVLVEEGKIKSVGVGLAVAGQGATVIDATGQAHHARHHRLPFAHRHRRRRERNGPDHHGRSTHRRFHRSPRYQHLSPIGWRRHVLEYPARIGQHHRRAEPGDQVPLGAGARGNEIRHAPRRASSSPWARTSSRAIGAIHSAIATRNRAWASSNWCATLSQSAHRISPGPERLAAHQDRLAAAHGSRIGSPERSVAGQRLIHCHAYRQDEILALLRTCEAFGVRIATLQHILEGYKVADVMAKHGVGGSSFSDWWAFKFEVYRRHPLQRRVAARCRRAGVVQLGRCRAGPAAEPGSGQGHEIRRRARG